MATKREKDFLHNLDKRMSVLEEVIKRLESNHLTHLQAQIDKIDIQNFIHLKKIRPILPCTLFNELT